MSDVLIRIKGRAGRITLNRPEALNALTYEMCLAIEAALDSWRDDDRVALVIIDATGDRAFCAGGDIQELYDTGKAGDFGYGQKFWADEYRLNAKIVEYPKPYIAFMQGFTMGGGVGISCHGSHRIVGENSQIAMPECGIGLVPDVGGSLLLAHAPGRLGPYLGLTADRMDAADAIYVGFADTYVPNSMWNGLISDLEKTGDENVITKFHRPTPQSRLQALQSQIDANFTGSHLAVIVATLTASDTAFSRAALKALSRNSPLSMAATLEMLHNLGPTSDIRLALRQEYRFTYRSMERGDFLEGVRAAIIDKDRQPKWKHELTGVTAPQVADILAILGENGLKLKDQLK